MTRHRVALLVALCSLVLIVLIAVARRAAALSLVFDPEDEAVAAIFGGLGIIFGVMLAQLVVAGWGDYQAARIASFREAAALRNIVRLADGFLPAQRLRILTIAGVYVRALVDQEWHTLRRGGTLDERAENALHDLFQFYAEVDMSSERGSPYLDYSLDKLGALSDARAERLATHRSRLPGFVWGALVLETALLVGVVLLFEGGEGNDHLPLIGALALAIVLLLALIWVLDHPFLPIAGITPGDFEDVQRIIQLEFQREKDGIAASEFSPRPRIHDVS